MGQLTSTEKMFILNPHACTSYQKISKWITDLYLAYHRSIKLLEENIREYCCNSYKQRFIRQNPKNQEPWREKWWIRLTEIKNWCSSKDTIKMNRQTTNTCKNICLTKDIFKIHNDLYNSIIERWTVQPN